MVEQQAGSERHDWPTVSRKPVAGVGGCAAGWGRRSPASSEAARSRTMRGHPSLGPPPKMKQPGARMGGFAFQLALLLLASTRTVATDPGQKRDICIVGAGAGGLQVGQLLQNSGRDFVIFERAATAGSFYAKYPVHRKLISLNKRNTGRDNTSEFSWRHDWNSLLGSDVPRMTQRTKERWPSADTLVEYLSGAHPHAKVALYCAVL